MSEALDNLQQLERVEAAIARTLKSVPSLANVLDHEPLGIIEELPVAYIRWLGPVSIVTAATGGEQDVTHAWRLEISVDVDVDDPEQAQTELKQLVQGVTLGFRENPRLYTVGEEPIVDDTRLEISSEAEYFRRPALDGSPLGPILYGLVFRLEADFTEYVIA